MTARTSFRIREYTMSSKRNAKLIAWRPQKSSIVEVRWHFDNRLSESEGTLIGYGILSRGGLWSAYILKGGDLKLLSDKLVSTDAVVSEFLETGTIAVRTDGKATKESRPEKATRPGQPTKS